MLHLLRRHDKNALIILSKDQIYYEGVYFIFKEEHLLDVTLLEPISSDTEDLKER